MTLQETKEIAESVNIDVYGASLDKCDTFDCVPLHKLLRFAEAVQRYSIGHLNTCKAWQYKVEYLRQDNLLNFLNGLTGADIVQVINCGDVMCNVLYRIPIL